MRHGFAHEATLTMAPDADDRAPGAAVTAAICGHWDHPGPCPRAPHHSAAVRAGDQLHLRVLFAAEPDAEAAVRADIAAALAGGQLRHPDGATTSWRLAAEQPSAVRPDERAHLARLVNG